MLKRCRDCGETKDISEFHKKRTNRDGYKDECKICNCDQRKRHWRETKEQTTLKNLAWDFDHIDIVTQAKRNWYEKNKEKIKEKQANEKAKRKAERENSESADSSERQTQAQ